jgi:hypothetical protein
MSALGFGEATPDTVRLFDLDRILTALQGNRAHLADSLGPDLATLAFVFSLLGTGGEEEVRMIAATQCDRLPRSITRHHRNSTVLLASVYARAVSSDSHAMTNLIRRHRIR